MEQLNKKLLKNIKILYVEDEKNISEQVKYFFDRYVKEFHIANNGEEGLELFDKVNPDVVITDIQMPKMNGLDMIKQLRRKDVPVIITTAYSDAEYFLKAIELKVDKFVIKPINLIELVNDVQSVVLENHLKNEIFEKDTLLEIVDKNVLISITDTNGVILDVSEAFCNLTGYSKSELIGKTHNILRHDTTGDELYQGLWNEITLGKSFNGEVKNKNKNGDTYWTKLTITPVKIEGKIQKYIAIRHDITNKKILETLAIKDDLTKIYNRRYFNKIINKEIRRVKREDNTLSLLCIDIDHFKKYNDTFGHQQGDEILISIANSLKSSLLRRSTDYLFRIGGEEFSMIFSGLSIEESTEFANDIVKNIESLELKHKDNSNVTISAGLVVQSSQYLEDERILYKYADDALYEAKEKGRNQVILSEHSK